jgi:hypothetical protein
MSIESAALAIRPLSATIMRFASEESSWISHLARGTEAMLKLVSKCATSSMDAGACTPKTNCSWRQHPRSCKPRLGPYGADSEGPKSRKTGKSQKPSQETTA